MAQRGLQIKRPTTLVCGMLEDNGRVLFLLRKDERGTEMLELPCMEVFASGNHIYELANEFKRQTGIDGEVHEAIVEAMYNAGSRKKKHWIPVLVFKITAKNRTAKPSSEFSGFRWIEWNEAKIKKVSRKLEWIRLA